MFFGKKKDYTLGKFPTYCPKVIAGTRHLGYKPRISDFAGSLGIPSEVIEQ